MPLKNQALTITYVAWDTSANAGKTGDASNHTLRGVGDGTEFTPSNAPAEVDSTNLPGVYRLALLQAETNYNDLVIGGKSSTANVVLLARFLSTDAGSLPHAAPNANGGLPILSSSGTTLAYTVSTTTAVTNAVVLPTIPTDWIAAVGVKADAVTKIQAGLSTYAGGAVASVTGSVGSIAGVTFPSYFGTLAINSSTGGVTVAFPLFSTTGVVAASPVPSATAFTVTLDVPLTSGAVATDILALTLRLTSGDRFMVAGKPAAAIINSTTSVALTFGVGTFAGAPTAGDTVMLSG